jgi:hypothetical protein
VGQITDQLASKESHVQLLGVRKLISTLSAILFELFYVIYGSTQTGERDLGLLRILKQAYGISQDFPFRPRSSAFFPDAPHAHTNSITLVCIDKVEANSMEREPVSEFSPETLKRVLLANKTANDTLIQLFRKLCYHNEDEAVLRSFRVRGTNLFPDFLSPLMCSLSLG